MGTLREEAQAYEPQQTLNIADLDIVNINNVTIQEDEGTDRDGKTFKYKYFEINGKRFRVPNTVLEEIQTIIKLKPSVERINVTKSGSGISTRYKVEALE